MRSILFSLMLLAVISVSGGHPVSESDLRGICIKVYPNGSVTNDGIKIGEPDSTAYYFIPDTVSSIDFTSTNLYPLIAGIYKEDQFKAIKSDRDLRGLSRALGIVDVGFKLSPFFQSISNDNDTILYQAIEIAGKGEKINTRQNKSIRELLTNVKDKKIHTCGDSAYIITKIQACNPYLYDLPSELWRIQTVRVSFDKSHRVSGAFVRIYSSREIIDFYSQKFLTSSGKHSFRNYIDFRSYVFFIPAQTPDSIYKFLNDRLDFYVSDPLYDTNIERFEDYQLNKLNGLGVKFENIRHILNNWLCMSPFYISRNKEFMYKIIWTDCICHTFNTLEFNKSSVFPYTSYKYRGDSIKFITSVVSVDPSVIFKNMEMWTPFRRFAE